VWNLMGRPQSAVTPVVDGVTCTQPQLDMRPDPVWRLVEHDAWARSPLRVSNVWSEAPRTLWTWRAASGRFHAPQWPMGLGWAQALELAA
jgi:hypothetical protein